MAINTAFCNSFKRELLEAIHAFQAGGGDTFHAALFQDSATLNKDTTVYDGAHEAVGVGYTAGGKPLVPTNPILDGDVALVSFQNVVWAASTISAMGCQIYNLSKANRSCTTHLFDALKESSDGDFTLIFPTADGNNAVIRLV